ncbi:MAG: DUF5615 family PIN-like protein [Bacteroidota bacterium]
MKILFDENLSRRIVGRIKHVYPEAIHVDQTELPDKPGDPLIWRWARDNGYAVVISFDVDFVDLLLRFGPPPKLIHLRYGNQLIADHAQFFIDNEAAIRRFVEGDASDLLEVFKI